MNDIAALRNLETTAHSLHDLKSISVRKVENMENVDQLQVEIQISLGEVNLILAALSELPYKVSFQLIQKIKQQGELKVAAAQGKILDPASIENGKAALS